MLLSRPRRHQKEVGGTTSCKEEKISSEESRKHINKEDMKSQQTEKWFSKVPSRLEETPQYSDQLKVRQET